MEQIRTLRDEAGQAGDERQVELCDLALDGDEDATRECERVLRAAAAMESVS